MKTTLFIDAHVHIYDCFILSRFFDSAWDNISREAEKTGAEDNFYPVLFLTESSGDRWFRNLKNSPFNHFHNLLNLSEWSLSDTRERSSLIVQRNEDDRIILIQGHQIVTSENLEVLAVGTDFLFDDGSPMAATIEMIKEKGGIAILPWGFGKWMGRRGQMVKNYIDNLSGREVFLGDNGGRPFFLSFPGVGLSGTREELKTMPGSDPLPFKSENGRAGSYGFRVEGYVDLDYPSESIKTILLDSSVSYELFGKPETPFRFVKNQLAMQIKKRMKKSI